MTERLFYKESHMKKFAATVISCVPSGDAYEVVLDRTAFFPEGGGQAADTGYMNDGYVSDVQLKGDEIVHTVDKAFDVGTQIEGELDWEKRFSRMQQHTGEHIVSGLIHSRFGYDNVGFHLGDETCTLDLNGPITKEQLKEIEYAANEAVFANLPVQITYPSGGELKELEYRSKIEIKGQVRIVNIPGYDMCACCAPHVDRTGEIGMIKFIHIQNYKGGVRISMVCGFRALADYQAKEESVKAIMFSLSSKEERIADAVERMKEENNTLKSKLADAQYEMLAYKVEKVPEGQERVCLFEEELSGSAPRELMNLVLDRKIEICAVFSGNGKDGYRYVIGSRSRDVRPLCKTLNAAFEGRGGGKAEMVQGSLQGSAEEIKACFYSA